MTPARLAAAIVALLVAASMLVLVRDSGGRPASVVVVPAVANSFPATTVEPPTSLPPSTPAVTTPRPIPAKSPAPAPPTSVAAGVPGPVTPPRPGTYSYRYSDGGPPVDGSVVIIAARGSGPQTMRGTAGDDHEDTVVAWTAASRTIVSGGPTGGTGCTWSPGLLSLKLPVTATSAWQADSTCRSGQSTVHRTEDAKVEGATSVLVGGRATDAWVISRHTLTEVASTAGTAVVESQSSELFAPLLGMVVYQVVRTATPQADGSTATTTSTAELLADRPV